MASEQDLQELLRILTTTRKLPMLQAMGQVKALQAANLKSIQQIAEAPPETVQAAIKDAAGAKALQTSCKNALKKRAVGGTGKRALPSSSSGDAKRAKTAMDGGGSGDGFLLGPAPMTPAELEQALALPVAVPTSEDDREETESRIAATSLQTNRAPVVLAFAVELLRYTMPEQPPSSRLSLAQAVVSANSRTKAVSLGLARGPSADDEGWGDGQPRVRILGREVAVLKRGGYTWRGEEEEEGEVGETEETTKVTPQIPSHPPTQQPAQPARRSSGQPAGIWSVSQTISLKGSIFVARATTMTDAAQRPALVRSLMATHPRLQTASHNAWAYRVRGDSSGGFVRQDAYDDGETGCGDLLLHVLRELAAVDTLVVLSRWFGGTLLGPDRWRLMRNCATGALAERLRRTGAEVQLGGEAVWGLDLEAMRGNSSLPSSSGLTSVVGMPIHRPEAARQYLLKSFATWGEEAAKKKKKTIKAVDAEKADNLGLLLGALRLLYDSWADHLSAAELDRRAWTWYVAVRPDVDSGPSGWGAKGELQLRRILDLRRVASE